jgi:hypothetical protein
LLANFSKKPKSNAFSYFKNSCIKCMKGPKVILESRASGVQSYRSFTRIPYQNKDFSILSSSVLKGFSLWIQNAFDFFWSFENVCLNISCNYHTWSKYIRATRYNLLSSKYLQHNWIDAKGLTISPFLMMTNCDI